eukprot:gb/GEZN01003254.1/.p1 GENE.gb/GEZN01003254.1/~~gb/GEZN01003254.1/.p1  ORF type:complete len:649 (+),score=89.33 gb/GEZN01003254.1/:22-1968(+)
MAEANYYSKRELASLQREVRAALTEHTKQLQLLHDREQTLSLLSSQLKSRALSASSSHDKAVLHTTAFLSAANAALRNGFVKESLEQRSLALHFSQLTKEEQAEVGWLLELCSDYPKPLKTNPFSGGPPSEEILSLWTTPFAESMRTERASASAHRRLSSFDKNNSLRKHSDPRSQVLPDVVQSVFDTLQTNEALFQQLRESLPLRLNTAGLEEDEGLIHSHAFQNKVSQYEFDEDDDPSNIIMNGSAIKCGTLNKLIERVTDEKHTDLETRTVFLLTYHSFTHPLQVLSKLESRYKVPVPPNLTPTEIERFKANKVEKIQIRVCSVIKNWLDAHWEADWAENEELRAGLRTLIQCMLNTSVSSATKLLATRLEKTLEKNQTTQGDKKFTRTSNFPKPLIANDVSFFSFERTNEEEFARQLTLKDWERFHAIKPRECLNCNWQKKNKEVLAPNLLAMINQFNLVTCWVQHTIVSEPNLEKRGKLYNKMLKIADYCRRLNNFNSLFAIYAGLAANPIHRLKKTQELVSAKLQKKFLEYKELFKGDKNSRNLRAVLSTTPTPCIPYIGIFLTDLTFIELGNPDMIGEMINFDKRKKLADRIDIIKQYQQAGYQLAKVDLVHVYFESHFKVINEETLYEISVKNEPKDSQQ